MSLVRLRGACAGVLVVAGLAGCGSGEVKVSVQAASSDGWEALAPAPLSPRVDAVAVWTGTEALFLGGQVESFCPPRATCELAPNPAQDGAAYNPETRTWRRVADAPVPLQGPAPAALVDGGVFALAKGDELLAYDVAADRWTSHGRAGASYHSGPVATGDGRLVFAKSRSAGLFYDPRTRGWSDVPEPPSSLDDDGYRRFAATPAGLVLTGDTPSGLPETPIAWDAPRTQRHPVHIPRTASPVR